MPQNRVIGITGITGSGTSTVAKILEKEGGYIIEADKLVHSLMLKNKPAYVEIVKIFGDEILGEDDEINRRVLGNMVFGDKLQLQKLENILHPLVISATKEILRSVAETHPFAVIDAPLLIESGMNKLCDSTWLITAPDNLRLERIKSRDNLTQEIATRRLKSRPGDEILRPHACVIIENDSDLVSLTEKVNAALRKESSTK